MSRIDEEEMESSATEGIRYETKSKYSLRLRDAVSVAVTTVVVLLPLLLLRAKTKDAYTLCVRKEYNSKTILRSEKKSKLSIDTEYC